VLLSFKDWNCTFGWNAVDCENKIVDSMYKNWAPFNIGFSSVDSLATSYTLFFTNDSPGSWGLSDVSVGAAPVLCEGSAGGAGIVFCGKQGEVYCANVASHELGHLLGLDHVNDPKDYMSWEYRGPIGFRDTVLPTVNGACRGEQNSKQELLKKLGPRR